MLTAHHILNKVPSKGNNVTLYELWKNRKPNLSYLQLLSCRAIVRLADPKINKLGERK